MNSSLQVLLLLAVIIAAAKVGGAISQRFGQAAVLGEMLMGLLLGPTVLNLLHWPIFSNSDYLTHLVHDVAELGVIFLMLLAGLETDLKAMRRVGLVATASAVGGMLLPFVGGYAIGIAFGLGVYPSIFMGTILTATSVSISAQTLLELGQLRHRVGNAILGAAVIDDVLGIILLSVVIALHGGAGAAGAEPLWLLLVRVVLFFAVGLALGRWAVPWLLQRARRLKGTEVPFAAAMVLGLMFAFGAAYFGRVAAITGSYFLGALLSGNEDLREAVAEKLRPLAYGFFVPVFFISVGLAGNLFAAIAESGAGFALLVIGVAIVGKVVGSGLGARLFDFSWRQSLQVGTGMVSRGEVGLIAAAIGLEGGVIGSGVYAVMLAMVLVTTLITPVLLRFSFRNPRVARREKEL